MDFNIKGPNCVNVSIQKSQREVSSMSYWPWGLSEKEEFASIAGTWIA